MTTVDDADHLSARGEELLAFAAALVPAYTRKYFCHGRPAWDCTQLTVHVERVFLAEPGMSDRPVKKIKPNGGFAHAATFVITLATCVPCPDTDDGEVAPSAADLDAAYVALADDGWLVWRDTARAIAGGTLFTGVACESVTVGDATPLGPEGCMAAWQVKVTALL